MIRFVTVSLAVLMVCHGLLVGGGHATVVCLGGGHHHTPPEIGGEASSCSHGEWVQIPTASGHDREQCDCTDVHVVTAATIGFRAVDTLLVCAALPAGTGWPAAAEIGLDRDRPPRAPPGFDPSLQQRLTAITATRLLV